jgi:hypothetical protein
MTVRNGILWYVTPCGYFENRVSEELTASISTVEGITELLLLTLMQKIRSSEMSVLTRATWRHIPEDGILYAHISLSTPNFQQTLYMGPRTF